MRAIAEAILHLASGPLSSRDSARPIDEVLASLQATIEAEGLDALKPGWRLGNLAAPRMLEVAAALSRLRGLRVDHIALPRARPPAAQ